MISVIMPCYNAAPFVEEAVRSVMVQTYANVELVVVDDGSTDGSVEILQRLAERYALRMTLLFQSRAGPYPARNLGLRHARGEFVAFLDADDYWTASTLEELIHALDAKNADIAYCGWQNVGEGCPGTQPYVPPDYLQLDTAEAFLGSCPWPIHAALVRRKAIDAVGGFSERRFSAMDYDLWLRLYAHTRNLVRVPEVLAFYRWHDKGQISKTRWKQVVDAGEVRRKFVKHNPECVAHLPAAKLRDLVDGFLMREGLRAYWKRNLDDAQHLFRSAFVQGSWSLGDLRYIVPAFLPGQLFAWLVRGVDHLRGKRA